MMIITSFDATLNDVESICIYEQSYRHGNISFRLRSRTWKLLLLESINRMFFFRSAAGRCLPGRRQVAPSLSLRLKLLEPRYKTRRIEIVELAQKETFLNILAAAAAMKRSRGVDEGGRGGVGGEVDGRWASDKHATLLTRNEADVNFSLRTRSTLSIRNDSFAYSEKSYCFCLLLLLLLLLLPPMVTMLPVLAAMR